MMLRNLVLISVAALVSSSIAGCLAIVPAFDAEDHCAIAGDTACASCIREKCQAEIDTCCGSKSCNGLDSEFGASRTTLSELDECGKGNAATCAETFQQGKSESTAEAVRGCVTTKCRATCLTGANVTPEWTCETPRDSDDTCAKCIYSSCKESLDDCCVDSSCGSSATSLRKDMGRCVAGDERGCAWLLAESSSGLEGVVRGCIVKNCAKSCLGDGLPHTTCSLYKAGAYCSCTNTETAGTQECSVDKVGGSCVIGLDGCLCGKYRCTPTGSQGCTCSFGAADGSKECEAPASGTSSKLKCCLKLETDSVSCTCGDSTTCNDRSHEYEVSSCNEDIVLDALRTAERAVESCSR